MNSNAMNSGSGSFQIFFEQGIRSVIASVNVKKRGVLGTPLLPREVTQAGVSTQKQQTNSLMFLTVLSENEDYDATYIQNYLNINVLPELQRIDGVGEVSVFGAKTYAMRIWLQLEKLYDYNMLLLDVISAH